MDDNNYQDQTPITPANNDDDQDEVPIEDTDPSASDVIHQQGVDPQAVEVGDREDLQRDLGGQAPASSSPPVEPEDIATTTGLNPEEGTDDLNTPSGQVSGPQPPKPPQ